MTDSLPKLSLQPQEEKIVFFSSYLFTGNLQEHSISYQYWIPLYYHFEEFIEQISLISNIGWNNPYPIKW